MAKRFEHDDTLGEGEPADPRPQLPSVADLVGANAPCDPIPPPPEGRHWDADSGRWIRDGVAIPPDPGRITYPPSDGPSGGGGSTFHLATPIDTEATGETRVDDIDSPVPAWAIGLVAVMFVVGIALGVLFTVLK